MDANFPWGLLISALVLGTAALSSAKILRKRYDKRHPQSTGSAAKSDVTKEYRTAKVVVSGAETDGAVNVRTVIWSNVSVASSSLNASQFGSGYNPVLQSYADENVRKHMERITKEAGQRYRESSEKIGDLSKEGNAEDRQG